jgi:hypothetical protein
MTQIVHDLIQPNGTAIPAGIIASSPAGMEFNGIGLARTLAGQNAGSVVYLTLSPVPSISTSYIARIMPTEGSFTTVGLRFRSIDGNNCWNLIFKPLHTFAEVYLEKKSGGSTTDRVNSTFDTVPLNVAVKLEVRTIGDVITVLLDDVVMQTRTDAFNNTIQNAQFFTTANNLPFQEIAYDTGASVVAPIGDLGADATITTGIQFIADASASSDPDGGTITYAYTLTRPDGSSSVLTDETTASPSFTPDIEGDYTLELTVNNGTTDGTPVQQVLTAVSSGDAVTMGSDFIATVGYPASLSAALSGAVTSSIWAITSRPTGSVATVQSETANPASFTPDVAGLYQATLTAATAGGDNVGVYYFRARAKLINQVPTASISLNGSAKIGEKLTLIAGGIY